MIDVSVTILKVDVHNIFLKCVNTDYEVEQKMKKTSSLSRVKLWRYMQRTHRTDSDYLPCNALFKKNMTRQ